MAAPSADHKKVLHTPKKFWVVLAIGLLAANQADKPQIRETLNYVISVTTRAIAPAISRVEPVDVASLLPHYKAFWQSVSLLTKQQRSDLGEFYLGMSRSLRADPLTEPVLTTTTSVRAAHRAGLLFLWKGFRDSSSNPSLQSSIEGVLDDCLGRESVPLNPNLRSKAADGFEQMARICATATR